VSSVIEISQLEITACFTTFFLRVIGLACMESSVDVTVSSLNAVVRVVVERAVPRGYNRKSKFPPRFSKPLRYYTVKKKIFPSSF
jgi:hypothetical protein